MEKRLRSFWRGPALVCVVLAGGYAGLAAASPPEVERLSVSAPGPTSYMRLRAKEGGRTAPPAGWTELGDVSPHLACAVVKSEDRGFFRHHGIEWTQAGRALRKALAGQPLVGGSTLSQQTARNLYLSPERSLVRKVREAVIARRLEDELGKRRILEVYLNVVEWGDGVWGVRAASAAYFGKPPSRLDVFEATFLASLLASPRQPLEGRFRERAERVQRRVVWQMYRSGLVDDAGWHQTWRRIDAVHAALGAGEPLAAALRAPDPGWAASPPPPREDASVIPAAGAVRAECGYDRELSEDRRLGLT